MDNNDMKIRPIDANALLAQYDAQHEGPPGRARALIENAPTLTYGERTPAKWEKARSPEISSPYWRCSACKDCCYTSPYGLDRIYYCPLCGAFTGGVVDQ